MSDYEEMLAIIKAAIDSSDAFALDKTGHKLKGSLRYLAAWKAADIAYELELMGKEGNLEQAGDVFAVLVEESDRLRGFLHQYGD